MAVFRALALMMLPSTAEGTSAAGGSVSTVNSSTELPFQRAAATRSGANSMAKCGCGMASSQRERRAKRPVSRVSGRIVEMLLNESHLVDFFQRSDPIANFGEAAFAQRDHAFLARDTLDFRCRPAVHNHFANAIGQVQQFTDRGAAVESGAGAFQATAAFHQGHVRPCGRIKTGFGQFLRGIFLWPFSVGTDNADQTLGHDAIQRGSTVV